jgi:hypothetical protein
MAVIRSFNWLGQARVDVPHLRLVESGVAGDFDALAGTMIAGGVPLIITGFKLDPSVIGSLATSIKCIVASSAILHKGASESGTIFTVPAGTAPEQLTATNTNVSGSFTNNAFNYVGIDLVRSINPSTQDRVAFLASDTGKESGKTIPLARTLNYRFNISTKSFSSSPNIAPIAIVKVDVNGNVFSIQDARSLMFRLGAGGDVPSPYSAYNWGQRIENVPNSLPQPATSTSSGTDPFYGADKNIGSFKAWMDSVMSRIWETGGGEHWYSPCAEHDVTFVRGAGGATTFTNGDFFEWVGNNLHWQGLSFLFANSTAVSNSVTNQPGNQAGLTDLANGECVFVDLQRGADGATLIPQKGTLSAIGAGAVPGQRWVIAWRPLTGGIPFTRGVPYSVGTIAPPASTVALGLVKLASAYVPAPSLPQVPTMDADSSGGTLANVLAGGLTRGTTTAGPIVIGTGANDNGITVSRTGQTTTIAGLLSLAQGLSIASGGLSVAGGLTVSSGSTSVGALNAGATTVSGILTASSLASTALDYGGAITIGGTNATSIQLGKAGITTTLPGALTVQQATNLNSTLNVLGGSTLAALNCSSLVIGGNVTVDGTGVTGPGSITARAGLQGYCNTNDVVGVAVNFRKKFPSAPSVAFASHVQTPSHYNSVIIQVPTPEGVFVQVQTGGGTGFSFDMNITAS